MKGLLRYRNDVYTFHSLALYFLTTFRSGSRQSSADAVSTRKSTYGQSTGVERRVKFSDTMPEAQQDTSPFVFSAIFDDSKHVVILLHRNIYVLCIYLDMNERRLLRLQRQ